MKKKKFGIVLLILVIMVVILSASIFINIYKQQANGVCPSNEIDLTKMNLHKEEFVDEFKRTIFAIDNWYGHKERKNIDIQALEAEFLPQIEKAEFLGEFIEIMTRLFAKLENSHSAYLFKSLMRGVNIYCSKIEYKIIVTDNLLNSEVSGSSIVRGSEIIEIDGIPVNEWIASRKKYISSSTDHWFIAQAVSQIFQRHQFEKEERTYSFIPLNGDKIEKMTLKLDKPYYEYAEYRLNPMVESKEFKNTGYISINSMQGEVVNEFDSALSGLKNKENLIIDLRKNTGGNSMNGVEIFKRLITQPSKALCPNITVSPHGSLNFRGDVVVLIGTKTLSAAESFIHSLHDSGRATFIGSASGGDSGSGPVTYETVNNMYFRFPIRSVDISHIGQEMEGKGLAPDIEIEQTYQDFLDGKDTILDFALEYINKINK